MGKIIWLGENKPILAMITIQIIYAGMALSAKAVFTLGVSPMIFVVYRQASATLALLPANFLALKRGKGRISLDIKGFSLVFFTAFIGVTMTQYLYYQGIKYSSASLASAVTNIIPAITFVIAASTSLEKVQINSPRTIAKVVGTIICIGGAISITLFKGPKLMNSVDHHDNWILGCVFLFSSCCCWAVWLILQVPISKKYLDPLSQSSWMCFLGTLQSAIFTFFLEPDLNSWKLNSTFEISCCLYAGVMGSALTVYLQSWCIEKRGPLFSAMFNPLGTVIVTILAIILLGENLYFGSLVGAIAVVIGLYVVLWGKAKDFSEDKILPIDQEKEPLIDSKFHSDIETV